MSVPISASYNHHYGLSIIGNSSRFRKIKLKGPDDPRAAEVEAMSHGVVAYDQPQYIAEQVESFTAVNSNKERR